MLDLLNTTQHQARVRPNDFLPVWIALGLWVGFIILFALQGVVVNNEEVLGALERACNFWLLWFFFLPFVAWLSFRFPLERPQLSRQACIHVAACVIVIGVTQFAYRTIIPAPPQPHLERVPSPKEGFPIGMRVGPDILIYVVSLSVCVAIAHVRKAQERERRAIELEARLAQAKLQALRMQINPHFLFNTLNAISSLVHTSPAVADDMITDLADFFRSSLESSDEQEILLSRELAFLQHYLNIEKRRFGSRLHVEQKIDSNALGALVPTLILQPLVENAIRHGIELRSDHGVIAIEAQCVGNQLKLSVSDNGKTPLNSAVLATPGDRPGIGLANTQARLQQLYGEAQSLAIEQGELGGWKVAVTLPFHRSPTKPI